MVLAERVPGCSPRTRTATGADLASAGLAPAAASVRQASSAATGTLRGRTAIILTFTNARAQADAVAALRRVDAFYASGRGWVAAPEQINSTSGEQSIVQDVALALHDLVDPGNPGASETSPAG